LKRLACLTVALVALATPTLAQPEIDFELASVELLTAKQAGQFQLIPNVTIHNFGNLATNTLEVVMHYGTVASQVLSSTISHIQEQHDCWQQNILNCAAGDCLNLYTTQGTLTGFCTGNNTIFMRCGCSYYWTQEYDWTLIEPGFTTVTVIVDPDDLVEEFDESNNEITIDLAPIPNESRTWGAIKSIY
jgi:hypothetical protein